MGLAGRPARNPVLGGDIPEKPEPLPKFHDDRDTARFQFLLDGDEQPFLDTSD